MEENQTSAIVPKNVSPLAEIRRLMSLPFLEEVLVFPVWEKPYVPMTTGQHVISESPFLTQLLQNATIRRDGRLGMFFVNEADKPQEITSLKQIRSIGVLGGIVNFQAIADPEGGPKKYVLFLAGLRRVRIIGQVEGAPLLTVKIQPVQTTPYDKNDIKIRALVDAITHHIHEILRTEFNPLYRNHLENLIKQINPNDPAELADLAAAFSAHNREDLQEIIEELNVEKRLSKALDMLRKELEVNKYQMQLQKQLEEKMSATHRKFMLNEQLKMIKKELGLERDDKDMLLSKYRERMDGMKLTEQVQKVINDELNKLSTLEPSSSEYNVCRTYLDWLTALPWGLHTTDDLDLIHAKQVLEGDHFGLDDVKNLILEFIAVGKLRGAIRGKIFCLIGPPGVGKTSIGKSIASALNRKFFRFSVGGLSDVAEIKGHRRTYVGAMPGKLIQCLKSVQSSNPVIMIDEIDKMQKGYSGDPASALLEVLDPEQNNSFLDHYLDVPFDLSKVLFLCTANVADTIPKPLQDRMEFVRLSGYVIDEKVQIARRFLIPEAMKETGLKKEQITLRSGAVQQLVHKYCREAGVRNLQKHIEKILRKVAHKIVTTPDLTKVVINEKNLQEYVGTPIFTSDRYYEHTPVGVTMGLSWTAMGGATLYIETVVEPTTKGESLRITGQMGNVMKESTELAYTYAKLFHHSLQSKKKYKNLIANHDPSFFVKNTIHMHVPEGATPKDGPSAGITMTTSLLSLALGIPVRSDLAMTGELTVTGKVLPIGGVKEKIIAARRSRINHVILPVENRKDFDELPKYITEGMEVSYANYYTDVFEIAFGDVKKQKNKAVNARKKRVEEIKYDEKNDVTYEKNESESENVIVNSSEDEGDSESDNE
jgi:ATP-dependent Lon protease